MKVIEDFESRPHKAVTFVVERGKKRQELNEQQVPKALPGYSGGRLPGRNTEEKGRKEGEEDEGSEERRVRNEIIKEVIQGIQKVDVDEGVENEGKRIGRQDLMQRWDGSQVENEEEESWQEGDQMAEQWEEEQHLEEIVERRRMEGSSLK